MFVVSNIYWSGRFFFASGEGGNTLTISKDGINWRVINDLFF